LLVLHLNKHKRHQNLFFWNSNDQDIWYNCKVDFTKTYKHHVSWVNDLTMFCTWDVAYVYRTWMLYMIVYCLFNVCRDVVLNLQFCETLIAKIYWKKYGNGHLCNFLCIKTKQNIWNCGYLLHLYTVDDTNTASKINFVYLIYIWYVVLSQNKLWVKFVILISQLFFF
jgi:hypothetical protein